jgi:hypothetical protein
VRKNYLSVHLGVVKVRIAKKSATIVLDTVNDQTAVVSSRRLGIRLVPVRLKKRREEEQRRVCLGEAPRAWALT